MALDGVFIKKLITELNAAVNSHIDKIHQPSRDEIVLLLRSPNFSKRLLISVKAGAQRIHFTDNKFENPPVPPMFCMLLRKYVGSGRITKITQPGFERLIEIEISSLNELGDIIYPRLIIELIGATPNIILVDETGRIIDALRRSSLENGGRIILPGASYQYPESQQKADPICENAEKISNMLLCTPEKSLEKALLNSISGFSPLICREIVCDLRIESVKDITSEKIEKYLYNLFKIIETENTPYLIKGPDGSPLDFSYLNIKQYSGFCVQRQESFSNLLDEFFTARTAADHINKESKDIKKLLTGLQARILKRINLRKNDLKKCENREQLRIHGELLKANLYNVSAGQTFAEVQNFYDENLSLIKIPLNPALSPAANAAKYFKDYKKTYAAEQSLTELIESDYKELNYIESLLYALERAESVADINELREELILAGFIKQNHRRKKKLEAPKFKEFSSPSGYKVLVGKNNHQNDYLTCSLASKTDMWFHVKNAPGSHVVVFSAGAELQNEDILFAAELAAANSKMCASANVPVDYTPIKYVKKPSGARPGMVIYTTNSTVYVTPK